MTATHQEQLLDHLRVLLFFIELNMLLFIMNHEFKTQKTAEPSTPTTQKEKEATESMGHAWILQREERGCYRTLLDKLITTDIPGYRNFTRMEPAFFYLIEERIMPHLRKSTTNFGKPLDVGLKLAVTWRHLSTGETYTSLQYHLPLWPSG